MDNCLGCNDNSSSTYSRCNPPISSNCTFYQGDQKICSVDTTFAICKGATMTSVQSQIFDRICQLIGDTDVSEVEIPTCLEQAWNDSDFTILNLFNLALTAVCEQKAALDALELSLDTLNPIVNVSLCCCVPNCNPTAVLRLSDALQGIITCVCEAKAQADAANVTAQQALTRANAVYEQVYNPTTGILFQIGQLIAKDLDLDLRLAAVEAKVICLPNC